MMFVSYKQISCVYAWCIFLHTNAFHNHLKNKMLTKNPVWRSLLVMKDSIFGQCSFIQYSTLPMCRSRNFSGRGIRIVISVFQGGKGLWHFLVPPPPSRSVHAASWYLTSLGRVSSERFSRPWCRPMMKGTGASKKWVRDAGSIGTYTCCQVKGKVNTLIHSATVISFW